MKPSELYRRKPEKTMHNVWPIRPVIEQEGFYDLDEDTIEAEKRIEVRVSAANG